MTVAELFARFLAKAPWVDPDNTPDGIEIGSPDQPVTSVGVGWSACAANLRAAAADGRDLFITHEPCFCEFWEPDLAFRQTEWGRLRARICEEHGMALVAMHDIWDAWPELGIRDSWARHLELGDDRLVARRSYRTVDQWLGLYEVEETTVGDFARHVARKVEPFGEDAVFLMGDPSRRVGKVAVGTGCGIPTFEMLSLGADVMVQVFDRAFQTFTRLPLVDLGANLIVVEHGVAEMPGMQNMALHLPEMFPGVRAAFYRCEPDSRAVVAGP